LGKCEDAVHDDVSVAVLDQVQQRRAVQHVFQIKQLVVAGELLLLYVVDQHIALQMHRNAERRRRVVRHVEDVLLAVVELQLPRPALIWWAFLPHSSVISAILSRCEMAYLVSSRDFLIGMICIERVLSSSAVTSTNGIHRLREAMPWP